VFGDDLERVADHNVDAEQDDQIDITPADTESTTSKLLKRIYKKINSFSLCLLKFAVHLKTTTTSSHSLSELLTKIVSEQKAGKKVLVFSYIR
jgi:hypothetical protein